VRVFTVSSSGQFQTVVCIPEVHPPRKDDTGGELEIGLYYVIDGKLCIGEPPPFPFDKRLRIR
jgi:hypothetical protein